MKLSNKLRELAERLELHANGPISHAKATVYLSIKMDLAPLLAEAERLEAQNYGLTKESVELAEEVKALRSQVTELEAQNARLRELVRSAYREGFDDGEWDAISLSYRSTGVDQSWDVSDAKAALDALDKEESDEA